MTGRVTIGVSALWLAGCAQVFGIDNTSAPPDVALPPRATLAVKRLGFGATIETGPMAQAGQSATYYIPDDVETSGLRRIAATADGAGVWSAELPDGVAAFVEYSVPDPTAPRRYIAFPNRDLQVLYGVYEPLVPEVAPENATLSVSLTLPTGYASSETFQIMAVGPYVRHALTAGLPLADTGVTAVGPATIAYDATTFTSTVGARPIPKITAADRLVALRYVGNDLTAAGEFAPFTQTGADTITSTLVDNPHAPLDVTVDPAAIATRLGMTTPANPTVTGLNWNVTAASAWQYGNSNAPLLHAAGFGADIAETVIATPYGNPFTSLGWKSLFTWGSARSRTFTPPALALPVTLYTGLNEHFEPVAGARVANDAGLPVLVSVNTTPLTSDGLTVTVDPNKAVTLSLVADKPTNTYYQFNIHELVPNDEAAPTALVLKNVFSAVGPATAITIPAGVLVTGKTYSIRAHCYKGGFPAIASGDFTMRDLPLTVGYLDSGVFTVAAP